MVLYTLGFIVAFMLILLTGIPVGIGLGFLAMGILLFQTDVDTAMSISVDKAYHALDSNVLIAIPLFILAAQLISSSGMGKRLFIGAKKLFGKSGAGLGSATIASSGIFSAMTGSSFVAASTMGLVAIPELRKAGYSEKLVAASIVSGGSLGSVIPPSVVMIVYGYLTDESIGKLFMAGVIPGILLILFYSAALAVLARKEINPDSLQAASVTNAEPSSSEDDDSSGVIWGVMAPVIILGGIYLGVFTATEAAAVAAVYCLMVGVLVYKSLNLQKLVTIFMEATVISSMIAIIVVGGAILGHVVIYGRIPQEILSGIIATEMPAWALLLIINIALFIMGMFLEVLALMYLAIPLLLPLVHYMEWDNIWFAVIILINVNLALITPPLGGVLYVVSHIGNMSLGTVIKGSMMPIAVLLFTLGLIIVFPSIATWLPGLMGV